MQNRPEQLDGLLDAASFHARDNERLCADVAAMLFPRAENPPSEKMLAEITAQLTHIAVSLEREIRGTSSADDAPTSFLPGLGFQHDPALVDFLIARHAERQIEARLMANSDVMLADTLPARLLADGHHEIAEAAQAILVNSSMNRRRGKLDWSALPPEQLHMLSWRVVASVQRAVPDSGDSARSKVQTLLTRYDEAAVAGNPARKMLHLIGTSFDDELCDAANAGLALFVAHLAASLKLDEDHILQLIDRPSIAAFAVIQKAAGLKADQAMQNLRLLFGFDRLTPRDIALFEGGFDALKRDDAVGEVKNWRTSRDEYLATSRPGQTWPS